MTLSRLLELTAANVAFVVVALAIGDAVLSGAERLILRVGKAEADPEAGAPSVTRLGVVLLIGFGTCSDLGVVLGLTSAFGRLSLALAGTLAVLLRARNLLGWWRWLRARLRAARPGGDLLLTAGAVLAGVLFLVFWSMAWAPPFAADALAYHLPDAKDIVHSHHLDLTLGGHWHYGNLPKLGEVLWAEGIDFVGYPIAQMLHMTILGAFVLFLFGTLRSFYSPYTAILAALLVLMSAYVIQFTTTPYIDGVVLAFEVGALLCTLAWVQRGGLENLARAALLIGFAMATKYSPAPTFLFAGTIVLATLLGGLPRRRALSVVGVIAGLVLVSCGYWYLKNLIRFGNPTYPLFFGHTGVSDAAYQEALNSIQGFGDRSIAAFIKVPLRVANVYLLPEFLAFVVAPFGLLLRRSRAFTRLLVVYFAVYTTYWFFFATHQLRFLVPGMIAGMCVLAAVTVTLAQRLPRRLVVAAAAAGLAAVVGYAAVREKQTVRDAFAIPHGFPQYQLGQRTDSEYLSENLGCQFAMLSHLRDDDLRGNVIDNWTVWHDVSPSLYATSNGLEDFAYDPANPNMWRALKARDLRFLYFKPETKARFFANATPSIVVYRERRQAAEAAVLRHTRLIWQGGGCRLYRIAPPTGAPGAG